MNKRISAVYIVLITLLACKHNAIHEGYQDFDGNWYYDSIVTFPFHIEAINKSYDIYYHIRNTIEYPYYNLYVKYELLHPKGKILKTALLENKLMHERTGTPFGKISKGVYDHEFPLLRKVFLQDTGTYILKLQQYMRLDTLPHINTVGFRVVLQDQ